LTQLRARHGCCNLSRMQEMKCRPYSLQPIKALHRTGTSKGEGY
jgi:hypothetical protein